MIANLTHGGMTTDVSHIDLDHRQFTIAQAETRWMLTEREALEFLGTGVESDSGERVNVTNALTLAAVHQAVEMISADVARIPLHKFIRDDADGRTRDRDHIAAKLVLRQAAPGIRAKVFWKNMLCQLLCFGNAYARIVWNGRVQPSELHIIPAGHCRLDRFKGTGLRAYVVTDADGQDQVYDHDDILHLEAGVMFDARGGSDRIHLARNLIGLGIGTQGYASRFFANGGQTGGMLMVPQKVTAEYKQSLMEGMAKRFDRKNQHKIFPLYDGIQFKESGTKPNDSQMVEMREEIVQEVSRFFNIPSSKMGIRGSHSYNSQEIDQHSYLDSTLMPYLVEIADECDAKLLSGLEYESGRHYFEHNTSAFLRLDAKTQAEIAGSHIQNGIRNPNEVRESLNLPKYPGGDKYKPVEEAKPSGGFDKGLQGKPRGPADARADEPDADRALRRRRIVFGFTGHVRQKLELGREKFTNWIDGELKFHRENSRSQLGEDVLDGLANPIREAFLNSPVQTWPDAVESACVALESQA